MRRRASADWLVASWTARGRRPEKQSGSVLIEFALVAPVLFALLFGIIDFSLVMFSDISLHQGTTAGAREAEVIATNPPTSPAPTSCATAGSFTGETQALICYTKSRIGLNEANTRVSIWFSTAGCTTGNCYVAGAPVIVCSQYPASSVTGFFTSLLKNVILTSKAEVRIADTNPDPTSVPEAETPLGSSCPSSCSTP